MADSSKMVSQVRYRVIDGATQQVLAVVKFGKAHPSNLATAQLFFSSPLA